MNPVDVKLTNMLSFKVKIIELTILPGGILMSTRVVDIFMIQITINTLIFGKIKYVKDEIVTSTGFTNATPQRKVLFIDRVTG